MIGAGLHVTLSAVRLSSLPRSEELRRGKRARGNLSARDEM